MLQDIIEISKVQIFYAFKLTKLALEKTSAKNKNEDDVIAIYKKSIEAVSEKFPLQSLLEKIAPANE